MSVLRIGINFCNPKLKKEYHIYNDKIYKSNTLKNKKHKLWRSLKHKKQPHNLSSKWKWGSTIHTHCIQQGRKSKVCIRCNEGQSSNRLGHFERNYKL